jgi:hypothetical protein
VAPRPTPTGLLGIGGADASGHDERPLLTEPPRHWRFAKYALGVVVPVGALFAAHRLSEPEGFDAVETNTPTAAAVAPMTTISPAGDIVIREPRPPARLFRADAFGHSGAVRVRITLPNEPVDLPIEFGGSTALMEAQWIAFDGKADDAPFAWPQDGLVRAPARPGSFWLVLSRGGVSDTIGDLALLVEHPMPNARATGINGYHMGRWPRAADALVPRGFVEVTERTSDFPLSPHLRMSDFIVHDGQRDFPKYLHVREALLDKIELTVNEIARMRGRSPGDVTLNVVSGFRSPSHNGGLSGAAQDSRHMYGDAADIGIDANNDGRLTEIDARLVAAAAEVVERKYPDLVGGIGLYINADGGGWPYVHIDVRGRRARWRGGVRRGAPVDSLPPDASFDSVQAAVDASAPPAPSPSGTARARTP